MSSGLGEYKLPKCWLGKTFEVSGINPDGTPMEDLLITPEMVNMDCRCINEMQAFFCMEGHLTECHVGQTCELAECSHWERAIRAENLDEHFDDEEL